MREEFKLNRQKLINTVSQCASSNGCGLCDVDSNMNIISGVNSLKSESPLMILFDEVFKDTYDEALKLLRSLLDSYGFNEGEYYISSINKCRLVSDRREDINKAASICRKHLANEFGLIRPRVILLLGSGAYESFFGAHPDGNKIRGEFISKNGYEIITSCSPYKCLDNLDLKILLHEDMGRVKQKLLSMGLFDKK